MITFKEKLPFENVRVSVYPETLLAKTYPALK